MISRALVLFSGGQDSATCLAWALEKFDHVETMGFDYGQRHAVELECRQRFFKALPRALPALASKLGADHMIDLHSLGQLGDTAMTRDMEITFAETGLPTTFVPGRNLLFFTYAAALAYRRNITHIIGGMCETDYSGYPDCRDVTIKALNEAINMGMDRKFELHTPLMWLDKGATWLLAEKLGGDALVDLIRTETHSCYKGDRSTLHAWGYGCDACPACDLRKNGFVKYKAG